MTIKCLHNNYPSMSLSWLKLALFPSFSPSFLSLSLPSFALKVRRASFCCSSSKGNNLKTLSQSKLRTRSDGNHIVCIVECKDDVIAPGFTETHLTLFSFMLLIFLLLRTFFFFRTETKSSFEVDL